MTSQSSKRNPPRWGATVALAVFCGLAGTRNPALGQEIGANPEAIKLEEVVVTARRREENLQIVPISVTALTQEALRENAVDSFVDLQYLVPSVTVATGGSRNEQWASIRGISGSATDGQAVVTYLNEVPLGPSSAGGTGGAGPGYLFDLDTVQVLEGPQGTLFGRNAVGGAILFQTKRPTDKLEGYLEGTYGNYRDRELQGAINVPITESLLVRIAINDQERHGFTQSLGTANHPDGVDLDDRNVFAIRGTLTYKPTEALQNDIVYSYMKSRDHGESMILTYVDPAGAAAAVFPDLTAALAQQQALGVRKQIAVDGLQSSSTNIQGVTDLFRYDVSDSLTFRNIASFTRFRNRNLSDGDGSPFPIFQFGDLTTPFTVDTMTEEAQLLGSFFNKRLTVTTGAYFENRPSHVYRTDQIVFGGDNVREQTGVNNSDNKDTAVFGHVTYDLSDLVKGLKFTGGYRYSWDRQFQELRVLQSDGSCSSPPPGYDANCAVTGRVNQSGPNWDLGLDYQVSPRTLLYVVGRHGYHEGGVNLGVQGASVATYAPEYVTDVEIGVKSDWQISGIQGRTNVAVYHLDYTDVQTFEAVPDATGTIVAVFGNAAQARSWGAELEGTLLPTDNLELGVLFDWMDFEYTGFGPGVDREELMRETLQNRPRFKYGLSARYHLPVPKNLGSLSLMARWAWQSETVPAVFLAGFSPVENQAAYGLLSLGAYWDNIGGGPVDVMFYMNNALDKVYKTGGFYLNAAFGVDTVTYGDPRTFGLRLRYRF
jgi:iron complex outermembrane receptor protein